MALPLWCTLRTGVPQWGTFDDSESFWAVSGISELHRNLVFDMQISYELVAE